MTKTFVEIQRINLAKGIIENGGRPSIVRAVCQITSFKATQLYKEINGVQPTAGLLPYDPEWIMKSPENCLHASVYYRIYISLSAQNITSKAKNNALTNKGEIYLAAYKIYLQTIAELETVLNINRAWHLNQQISLKTIGGVICSECGSEFVSITDYPDQYKTCPVCDTFTDATGRIKWKKLNIQIRTNSRNKRERSR